MAQAIAAERARGRTRPRVLPRVALLVAVVVLAVVVGLSVGEPLSLSRALSDPTSRDHAMLLRARLPRVLLGLLSGAGLSVTGAAYQALLRNPLAEPYVLGVAGGAALGATLALAVGIGPMLFTSLLGIGTVATALGSTATAIAAAIGSVLATSLVYALGTRGFGVGRRVARGDAASILLAGVVVNAIAASAITFVKTIVRAATAQQLLFWLSGFLDVPTTGALVAVAAAVAIGGAILVMDAPRLNLLAMGDEHAAHLGVDVRALERRVFLASSIVIGAVVATCGVIGFLGLLVPHILRKVFGADNRVLVPASLALGGATLVLCDALSRATFRVLGTEPPVGAITALVGGPLFLVLLARGPRGRQG